MILISCVQFNVDNFCFDDSKNLFKRKFALAKVFNYFWSTQI